MPIKPKRPCVRIGCPSIAFKDGYCKKHQYIADQKQAIRQKKVDERRGSAAARGYDGQWQKVRRLKFLANPLCEWCEAKGLIVAAEEIHHTIPIKEAPEKRLEMDNLESLCKRCHDTTKRGANHENGCEG